MDSIWGGVLKNYSCNFVSTLTKSFLIFWKMKKKDIIKELEKLQNYPVPHHRGFFASMKSQLNEFMEFNPIREDLRIYAVQRKPHFLFRRFKYLVPVIIAFVVIFGGGGAAFARSTLPGDTFYPMKILGEDLRSALTLRPEAQAKLQIRFTLERIEELEEILNEKGVDIKRISIVQERLQQNLQKATGIVAEISDESGTNAQSLAKELDQAINVSQVSFEEIFENHKQVLEQEEQELKTKGIAEFPIYSDELEKVQQIKSQKALLEKTANEIDVEMEENKIELAKASGLDMVEVAGVILPIEVFDDFNNILSQLESAFQSGDFTQAERLMEQSREILANTTLAKDLLGELGSIEEEVDILKIVEDLKIDLDAEEQEEKKEIEPTGGNSQEENTTAEEEISEDTIQTSEEKTESSSISIEASVGDAVEGETKEDSLNEQQI